METEKSILMVDDDSAFLEQAAIFLDNLLEDYEIQTENSADKALGRLNQESFEAIVSDYQMPGKDGLEFLKILRKERNVNTPFLVFTGKGREDVAMDALNLGADRYIQKGGNPKSQYGVLAQAVKQEVEHHTAKQKLEAREKHFEKSIQEAPYPAMLHAEDGKVISINETWTKITGYDEKEINTIEEWVDLAYEENKETIVNDIESLFHINDRKAEGIYTISTKDGEKREWKFSSSYIGKLPDGRATVLSMADDITEKKKTEAERNEYYNILQKTFQGVNSLLMVIDENHNIALCNWEDHEWVPEEKRNKRPKCYRVLKDLDEPCDNCPPMKTFEDGQPRSYKDINPIDGSHKDIDTIPIFDEENNVEYVLENVRDVTEQREREQRITRLNSILKAIRNVNQTIVQGNDVDEIMQKACDILVETMSYQECTIGLLEDEGKISTLAESGEHKFLKDWKVNSYGKGEAPECIKKALKSEKTEILNTDSCDECEFKNEEDSHITITFPMKSEGDVVGIFHIGLESGVELDEEEMDLLQEVVNDLVFAMEKIRSEKQLEKTKQRLELAMDASEHGFWDWNLDTDEVYFSPRYYEILGYDQGELDNLYETWKELMHPKDKEEILPEILGYIENAEPFEKEFRLKTKSGEWKWILAKGKSYEVDEDGNPHRAIGTQMDIDERKRKEKKIKESQKRYKSIFQKSPNAIWEEDYSEVKKMIDKKKKEVDDLDNYLRDNPEFVKECMKNVEILDFNNKVLELYDAEEEEEYLDNLDEVLTEKSLEIFRRTLLKIAHGGTYLEGVDVNRTLDGEKIDVFVTWKVVPGHEDDYSLVYVSDTDITDRVEANEKLKESRKFLQKSLDSIPANIAVIDEDGEILKINERWKEFAEKEGLGWNDYGIGHNYLEISKGSEGMSSEGSDEVYEGIKSIIEGKKEVFRHEYPCHSPDEKRWFLLTASSFEIDGEVRVIISHSNITEKKLAEENLKESRSRLKRSQEVAKVGSWEIDLETEQLTWSDETYRIFGLLPDEPMDYQKFLDMIHPEDRDYVDDEWNNALGEGEYDVEHRIIADEDVKWVREKADIKFDEEGDPERVIGSVQDITDRKKLREELKQNKEELETILESVPAMIWYKDTKNNLVRVNRAAAEITGYSPEEIEGKSAEIIYPEKAEDYYEDDLEVIESGEPKLGIIEEMETESGKKWVITHKVPYRDAEGEILGVIVLSVDITKRKEYEEKLKQSKEEYKSLIDGMNDAVFIHDMEGNFLTVNQEAVERLGYSEEELLSMSPKDIDAPEFAEKIKERMEEVKEGDISVFETKHITKDGKEILVEINSSLISYRDKHAILSVARDITERKEAEERLKRSERKFRKTFESSPDPTFLLDEEGVFVDVNEAAIQKLGFEKEEIVGKSISEMPFFSDEGRKKALDKFEERKKRPEEIDPYEINLFTSDGEEIYTEVNVGTFEEDGFQGEIVIARDITERKEAQKRFKKYVENSPYGVFVEDNEGNYVEVNEKACEITGYSEEELLDMNILDLYEPETQEKAAEKFETLKEEGQLRVELPFKRKDGKERIWDIFAIRLSENRTLSFVEDITARKEIEERENMLHSLLRHDVKNKVLVTQGYLELLEEFELDDDAIEYIKKSRQSIEKSLDIISKVRNLRKAKSEDIQEIEVISEIQKAVSDSKSRLVKNDMEVDLESEIDQCKVKGGNLMKELFSNLIENSINHSEANNIKIEPKLSEEKIVIRIEDDGIGIPEEDKETIFEKGYTTDEERGTGLGLYLVRRLLDIYDGSIDVKNSELGGARFDVHLKRRC